MPQSRTRHLPLVVVSLALAVQVAFAQEALWEKYMEAATKAYQEGRYAEAEKQLNAALKEAEEFGEQDPRLATSLNNLAELYRNPGQVRRSRAALPAVTGDSGEAARA